MSTAESKIPAIASLLEPICEDAPTGESLRYAPQFSAIREARRADDAALPQGAWVREVKSADWAKVADLCVETLSQRSKDLQIAVWLGEAWMHLEQLGGLIAAAELVRGLHERYALTMFPTETPGEPLSADIVEHRGNLICFLNEKLALQLLFVCVSEPVSSNANAYSLADLDQKKFEDKAQRRENPNMPQEEDPFREFEAADASTPQSFFVALYRQVQKTLAEIASLDAVLDEVYGKENPGLNGIKSGLERIVQHLIPRLDVTPQELDAVNERDNDSSVTEQNVLEESSNSNGFEYDGVANPPSVWTLPEEEVLTTPGTGNGVRQGPANRTQAYDMIRMAADYLARTEPHSPVPYLLRRAFRWGSLSLQELLPELLQNPEQLTADSLHGDLQQEGGIGGNDPFRY
jgi:type VI secretion system ImpA family protein